MKKAIAILFLLALFCVLGAGQTAQEKSYITVTGSELNNGVVILDVLKGGKAYALQCNQAAQSCTVLKNGRYQMVELPQNFGMYECKYRDVEVYAETATTSDKDVKLGEYCLLEK